jgi:nuclear pore complex protein Nup155
VDNALFLWRYDVPDDVPVEYAGEEQAIVAVAVATPKPGVFLQSIERLIVVATTTEIVLLGAAFEHAGDEEDDILNEPTEPATMIDRDFGADQKEAARSARSARVAFANKDMTLHALDYACVTDDVVVKDFACTSTGRIFFAGDDEALYEVEYSAGDTWRARRCRKTCHHSATPKLLPSILRLRAPDALRQVLVDEDRCALYTRSENGVVAVYDLGATMTEAPRRVAEVRDVAAAAQMARGGGLFYDRSGGGYSSYGGGGGGGYSSYGGGGGGGRSSSATGSGSSSTTQKGKRLVHVAVVSARESSTVTLVAVCADGRRVYLTSLPSAGGYGRYGERSAPYGSNNAVQRGSKWDRDPKQANRRVSPAVTRLAVLATRDPPPQASAARGMTAAQSLRATTTARPLEVEAAYYAEGVMLLSDAAEADEDARLFFASRDASLPSHLRAVSPAEAGATYGAADAYGAEGAGYGGGVSGGGGGAAAHAARSLREAVSTRRLTGRAASSVGSMGEVPAPPAVLRDLDPPFPAAARPGAAGYKPPAPRLCGGELATQHVAPRRKFVIVTNAGVVLVEKARPVDALRELLLDDVHEHIARFFAAYGQAEAATMCLALALGACADVAPKAADDEQSGARVVGAGAEASGSFFSTRASSASAVAAAAERARLALEDPRLTGEPRVEEDRADNGAAGIPSPSLGAAPGSSAQFDMGRAIVQPRMHFSGVHAAAYTYAARVLAAVWERPMVTTLAGAAGNGGGGFGGGGAKRQVSGQVSRRRVRRRLSRNPKRIVSGVARVERARLFVAPAAPRGCGERRRRQRRGGRRVRRGGVAGGHTETEQLDGGARGVHRPGGHARVAREAPSAARAVPGAPEASGVRGRSRRPPVRARASRGRPEASPRRPERRSPSRGAFARGVARRASPRRRGVGAFAGRRRGGVRARRRAARARGPRGAHSRRLHAPASCDDGGGCAARERAGGGADDRLGVRRGRRRRRTRGAEIADFVSSVFRRRRAPLLPRAAVASGGARRARRARRRGRRAPNRGGARGAAGGARGGEPLRHHGGARGRGVLPRARRVAALRRRRRAPPPRRTLRRR